MADAKRRLSNREYVSQVAEALTDGLEQLSQERPPEPLLWLGRFLASRSTGPHKARSFAREMAHPVAQLPERKQAIGVVSGRSTSSRAPIREKM